jgi:crossover junction endodeoxyribonuclease RuvC
MIEAVGHGTRLVAYGALRLRGASMSGRLLELGAGLREVLREQRPSEVAVETQFFGKSASAALAVGMARGVAIFVAAESGAQVHEYSPATVKKAVVGNGNASKDQVASMVRILLGLTQSPGPADVTDAIAIAIAHAHRGPSAALQGLRARSPSAGPR